jgi:uncharacterized membrane protein
MWHRWNKSYPLQIEIVPLLVLLLGFYMIVANYGALPERIPTHFGLAGTPDGYGGKEEIFLAPVIGAGAYLLLTVIMGLFAGVKDPMKLINLPVEAKAVISAANAEDLRVFMLRTLLVMKVLIMGLVTYLTYDTVQVALGHKDRLGSLFFVFTAGILIAAGAMLWKALKIASAKPEKGSRDLR